ncbi:MAG: O-acetylhomoserine aminocarboxypropyltransferase/cysteine synthase [Defluviitaleaceae bacterium]|nr:O-acetylhomoserine aminocarboxypropyltransferase/cysteine synthase [Defluviitaleaceae bacterium]MCL2836139.1 O-acetylhomoserine aminocarboxypropyltransferase/cysteine synthase [Defluviitaleaceae bacterium]
MPEFETLQARAGYTPEPATKSFVPPLYMTAGYLYDSAQDAQDIFELRKSGNIYSRLGNPTTAILEERLNALEGGVGALAFASGHAALVGAIFTLMEGGQHIAAGKTLYGGTVNMLTHSLPRLGITTTFASTDDPENFRKAIRPETRLIYIEVIGNPQGNLCDIDAISAIAREHGVPVLVDATLSTPYLYKPFEHGADLVLHSTTKYICGHGTTMGGVLIDSGNFEWANGKFPLLSEPDPSYHGIVYTDHFGKAAFISRARTAAMRDFGGCPSPFNSFLLLQGVETLSLRMERHTANARAMAQYLTNHPAIERVNYPELPSSPYKHLADRDWPKGCGGLFSIELKGGREAGASLINSLTLISNVTHFADVRSMACHPATTTHSQMTPENMLESGIPPGLVRISAGLEHIDDLIADFEKALVR